MNAKQVKPATPLSTHRAIQVGQWHDRASGQRVRYYVNADRADSIGNRKAAAWFRTLAKKWENIRMRAAMALGRDALARRALTRLGAE